MLLAWPRADGDCADNLGPARTTIATMAAHLGQCEDVILIAPDDESRRAIAADPGLARTGRLRVISCGANDIWARDFGPVTVISQGRRKFLDFRFDGWGGRYPAQLDNRITAILHAQGTLGDGARLPLQCVLEGGSIDGNGDGALLTTRACLIEHSRNPDMSVSGFEALFRRQLGVDTVHWLGNGALLGDDTDGHVDTLARFTAPNQIVYQGCDDPSDAHYQPLRALAAELASLRDRHGKPYRLRALPLPAPIRDAQSGRRLPAGYANFLIANRLILMPAYDDPADARAARILQACFPRRRIVGIDARPLIRHNGALHCAAMQIPAHD